MKTREQNVVTYMNEWRDGYWHMQTPKGIPNRVADEVIAYAGLQDSTANYRAYEATVAGMIASAALKVTYHDDKSVTVEVP